MNILKADSYERGIAFSVGLNSFAKLLYYAFTVLVAFYFGNQSNTDVFFYSLSIITLIATYISNLNLTVLIPTAMKLSANKKESEAMAFLTYFIYFYLFLGIGITILLLINPVWFFGLFSKFEINVLQSNKYILYYSIPVILLSIVTKLLADILSSFKYFTLSIIPEVLNNLLMLLFLIILYKQYDISSSYLGVILAYIVSLLFLIVFLRRKLHWTFSFKKISFPKEIIQNSIFIQIGNFFTTISVFLPIYLLSGLNPGIVTALNYGKGIAEIPNQFLTTQFANVAGIRFNELFAQKDFVNFNSVFHKTTNLLLFILVPLCLIFWFFPEQIISILFMRGKFDHHAVIQSSVFLKWFGLLMPFSAFFGIVSKIYISGNKVKQASIFQIIINILLIIFSYIFIKKFNENGYAFAVISVSIINLFVNYYLLRRMFEFLTFRNLFSNSLKIVFINVLLSFSLYEITILLFNNINLYILSIVCIIYALMLYVLNYLFKINKNLDEIIILFKQNIPLFKNKMK